MSNLKDSIDALPGSGGKFWTAHGSGNLKKRLYQATKHGDLQNLRDNVKGIMKVAEKREKVIRQGKYDRKQRLADFREISKDPSLNKDDKRDIKLLIEHWGKTSAVAAKPAPKPTPKPIPQPTAVVPKKSIAERRSSALDRLPKTDSVKPGASRTSLAGKNYFSNTPSSLGGASSLGSNSTRPPRLVK
ncbi:hypothetical protein K8R42_03195 [bacterium]|nr:hypothetical protein [bacterium]